LKFQDTLSKRKRVLLCRNPKCETNSLTKKWHKKSLLGIKTIIYTEPKELEKLIFYICSKCGYYNFDNFGKPITNQPLNLHAYIIQDELDKDYEKMLKSRSSTRCLYCQLNSIVDFDDEFINKEKIEDLENKLEFALDENDQEQLKNEIKYLKKNTKPIYKIKKSIYKLFIKGKPRRDYIGFLCLNCKSIYYDSAFKKVNWQNMTIEKINPTKPLIEVYEKKAELHLEYQKMVKEKTTNNAIRKQELETWENLQVKKPGESSYYQLKYFGPHHTGGSYESRMDRISLTLDNLTIRKAKKIIESFGTKEQKEEIEKLGL